MANKKCCKIENEIMNEKILRALRVLRINHEAVKDHDYHLEMLSLMSQQMGEAVDILEGRA